jgi:formiminoglutamase
MRHFQFYGPVQLQQWTRHRRYETKLGEKLRTLGAPLPQAATVGTSFTGEWIRGESSASQAHTDIRSEASASQAHTGISGTNGSTSMAGGVTVGTKSPSWKEMLKTDPATYVLVGIPEDIGVKANGGMGGAGSAWNDFMSAFLNIQSTDMFSGEEVLLLGAFDFSEVASAISLNALNSKEALEACRHAVANVIDEEVEELIKHITLSRKIPIVIGGGHNNAYPILKGAAKGWAQAGRLEVPCLNAINLDAHADFRIEEGRHSGNPFRYAMDEGFLERYAVVGLHENYNSQSMMDDLYENTRIMYTTYEDIFLKGILTFDQAIQLATSFTKADVTGIELDMDAVDGALASAQTPCGVSPLQARQYLWQTATELDPAYLHIAEGASHTDDGRTSAMTGKIISYLVSDFVKALTASAPGGVSGTSSID